MSFMITSRTLLCRNFQLLRTHQYRNCDHLSTLSSYTVSNEGDTSATTGVNSKAKIIFVLGGMWLRLKSHSEKNIWLIPFFF